MRNINPAERRTGESHNSGLGTQHGVRETGSDSCNIQSIEDGAIEDRGR
jgi:hypothetical protein